jgi:hypothetical protein
MDTLPRNFFRGNWWRSYWGTLASCCCCWLSRSFVLKENAAGFFPRRMSPKWSGTQSVDTREIVYSFLLETIQRLDRNLVNRSENFSIRVTRIIIDAALFLFEPDDFTSKCVHSTHTHIHRALFVLFWKPDLWCWRHVPSALILHVVRRRSRQTFLWLSCHSNTNNVYVWKLIWT